MVFSLQALDSGRQGKSAHFLSADLTAIPKEKRRSKDFSRRGSRESLDSMAYDHCTEADDVSNFSFHSTVFCSKISFLGLRHKGNIFMQVSL